jgi:hypothetical protein
MPFNKKLTKEDHRLLKEMALCGEKLEDIAKAMSTTVSRQRIKQLTQHYGIDSFSIRRDTREKERHETMFKKFGPKWNDSKHRKSFIYQEMKAKFRGKKANAKRSGWEFTVEFGDLEFPTHCPILGLELDYFAPQFAENSISFDRIDSTLGYTKENTVILSWRANRIKNDGTADEHQKIADFLYQF